MFRLSRLAPLVFLIACGGESRSDTDLGFVEACARMVPSSGGESGEPGRVERADSYVEPRIQEADCASGSLLLVNRTSLPVTARLVWPPDQPQAAQDLALAVDARQRLDALRQGSPQLTVWGGGRVLVDDRVQVVCHYLLEMEIR